MVGGIGSRARTVVGLLLLASSAALVVVLGVQTRVLRQEVRRARGREHLLHVGDVVPVVRAPALVGDSVTLGGGPRPLQVLFVLTTTCPYCLETLPSWRTIADSVAGRPDVALYGVSLYGDSATAAYAAAHALPFRVVRFPTARAAGTYRAVGSPITLVVDSGGGVRYVRGGVLTAAAVDSLFAALEAPPATRAAGGPS
jgi:peroxiredoxin